MKIIKDSFSKKQLIPYFFICLFALGSALSLFMNGDDYIWCYSDECPELSPWRFPNGRLFSNFVTKYLTRIFSFRIIFVFITFSLTLIFLGRLFDYHNITKSTKYYIASILFVFIPHGTYAETVNWISGYTNYVFSMLIIMIYIFFVFKCIFDGYIPKPYSAALILLISLCCGLCVEHVTIYCVILGAVTVILAFKKNKKVVLHTLAFLMGSVVSCFLMFGSSMYSDIYSNGDSLGGRAFHIGFENIMQNAYSYVFMHYTKDYWIISAAITVCFTVLYIKKDFTEKSPKYLKLCMVICWLYAAYSVFTMCVSDLRVFTPAMRVAAFETAFSFIYVVAIAYLIYVFLDKNGRIRAYFYMISTLLLTGPFLFISPVTPRCFLANYIFWILLCGEIFTAAIKDTDTKYTVKMRVGAFALAFCSVFLVMTACITNKYINELRYDYIKEQLQDKKNKQIRIILLPYTEFNYDDLQEGLIYTSPFMDDIRYADYIMKYYGIEIDKDIKYVEQKISPYDYYIEKISE